MINWMVGGLLAVAVFFALRYTWRQHRSGKCCGGCSGCSGCSGCGLPQQATVSNEEKEDLGGRR